MTKLQGIYRVQKPGSALGSWCVQVRVNGRVQSKSFADSKYGGKDKARDAATKHRNELLESLGLSERLNKPENPYPGVSRTESTREQGGYKRSDAYWQAYWVDATGKQRTQRFSIRQLGEEGARSAAIKARKHAEQSLAIGEDPFFYNLRVSLRAYGDIWTSLNFSRFWKILLFSFRTLLGLKIPTKARSQSQTGNIGILFFLVRNKKLSLQLFKNSKVMQLAVGTQLYMNQLQCGNFTLDQMMLSRYARRLENLERHCQIA